MSWDKTMFRVIKIPRTLTESGTAEWLGQALEIDLSSIKILSLAADAEDLYPSNTATVAFRTRPDLLNPPGPEWWFHSPLRAGSEGDTERFRVDISFENFTPLSPVNIHVDESKLIDCIVVHSWGGHAHASFRAHGDSLYSWIRDDLPKRIPELRIWTYGYRGRFTAEEPFVDINSDADALRWSLRTLRKDTHANEVLRPLIFIVHSLGGWLFQRAMVLMNQSSDIEDKQNRLCTYGALFFGVPPYNMNTMAMATMLENMYGQFSMHSLDQIGCTRWREQEHKEFYEAFPWRESKIVQFRELRKTPTIWKHEMTGKRFRTGPPEFFVSPTAATSGRHWETGEGYIVEIDADHFNIVKFSEGERREYSKVIYVLREFVEIAHKVIKDRRGSPIRKSVEAPYRTIDDDVGKPHGSMSMEGSTEFSENDFARTRHNRVRPS